MKALALAVLLAVAGNAAAYCPLPEDDDGYRAYRACLEAEDRAEEAERRAEEAEERAERAEDEAAYNRWYYDE